MRDNLHREVSLGELAQAVNLSVWRLTHIFSSEMGSSPIRYLRQLRMERARYLLETSFLSVKEITHSVGLNDESHFVRDFKKAYGTPPTLYRMRFKGGHMNESRIGNKSEHEHEANEGNGSQSTINKLLAKSAMRSILLSLNILTYLAATFDA